MSTLADKELFRLGFLLRAAEEGLTPEDIRGRVKKAAGGLGGLAQGLLWDMPVNYSAAKLVGGAGLGALGGWALADATSKTIDPEDAKKYELIAAYRQQAERARQNISRLATQRPKPTFRAPQLTAQTS